MLLQSEFSAGAFESCRSLVKAIGTDTSAGAIWRAALAIACGQHRGEVCLRDPKNGRITVGDLRVQKCLIAFDDFLARRFRDASAGFESIAAKRGTTGPLFLVPPQTLWALSGISCSLDGEESLALFKERVGNDDNGGVLDQRPDDGFLRWLLLGAPNRKRSKVTRIADLERLHSAMSGHSGRLLPPFCSTSWKRSEGLLFLERFSKSQFDVSDLRTITAVPESDFPDLWESPEALDSVVRSVADFSERKAAGQLLELLADDTLELSASVRMWAVSRLSHFLMENQAV
jgi:hypothetical protein